MQPTGKLTNIAPGFGGLERDPQTLASHAMPGGTVETLRSHVSLAIESRLAPEGWEVVAKVQVRGVGHRVPTGHPSRSLILWVRARDENGQPARQLGGPVLSELAGVGSPETGGLAGQPGQIYAKVFEDLAGRQPVPYWRPNRLAYDTRLHPDTSDERRFLFEKSPRLQVEAQLLYRRFSHLEAQEKGWRDNEIVIARRSN